MTPPHAPPPGDASRPPTLWTLGHSTLPIEGFIERIAAHRIEVVADVRRHPASRRQRHFNRDALARALRVVGVDYVHLESLGGRREPAGGGENAGLREPAFRGYADWMATPGFAAGLDELLARAGRARVAVMCAEADVAHCHRRLLADALAARGVEVLHIAGTGEPARHALSPEARLDGGRVSYPAPFF